MDVARLLAEPGLADLAAGIRADPDGPFPIWVAKVKLTWRCNLRCVFCALWKTAEPEQPVTADQVDRLLNDLAARGLRKVHFSGGEVLLRPDFETILGRAAGLGLQVNLTTNGTLLDKEWAKILVDQRVHTVAFSIDGPTERRHDETRGIPGAWRKTWKGIEILKARKEKKGRGPVIAVNTVVTRKSIGRMSELHQVLSERGVDTWRLLPVRTFDKRLRPTAEQWTALAGEWTAWRPLLTRTLTGWRSARDARQAAKGRFSGGAFDDHICYAPWFSLFLDADGLVYSCCTGRRVMPAYGRLEDGPPADLLESTRRREVLAGMASGHEYEVCRTCDEFREENERIARAGGPSAPSRDSNQE